jgi:DNA repair protein RadD
MPWQRQGLGADYDVIVECPGVADLIAMGFLVPYRLYAPTAAQADLSGVKTQAGDYQIDQLAERMDKPRLVADVVSTWHRLGDNRQTVVFATNVGHSRHLCEEFVRSGVVAEHIDGDTPIEERESTLARFRSGQVRVLTNCGVMTEGTDVPIIGTISLARPTKSLGLYLQMVGRGFRTDRASGKKDLIVLDHGDHARRLAMPDDKITWTLNPDRTAGRNRTQEERKEFGTRILECSQCGALRESGKLCPACGFLPRAAPKYVAVQAGDLIEIKNRQAVKQSREEQAASRRQWLGELVAIAEERGRKPGWVAHQYKAKFGEWPPRNSGNVDPIDPTPEVRSWVRSRDIAFAKAQEKLRSGA